MPGALHQLGPAVRTAALHFRTARRLARRARSGRRRIGPLDERLVFVVGSPRSGTTFLAGAIGSLPGFIDLGEVAALKAELPRLATLPAAEAALRVRRLLVVTGRLALAGGLRAVEQTPETAFALPAVERAFPAARIVHIVRDGRDVVCSLLERGWLSAGRGGADDAGLPYGQRARFWVEPGRAAEFEATTDARRAAWAWRAYLTAARDRPADRVREVRYERLAIDPDAVAAELAAFLDAPREPLAAALAAAHASSVGRFSRELTPEQLREVEAEAGELLHELGYLGS